MIRSTWDNLWGVYELARLGAVTRFRFNGRYWKWRHETAFGRGTPGRLELIHAALRYGRWIHQMRQLR